MLTIATVRRERCAYYLSSLADEPGQDALEQAGVWFGSGARALGLEGAAVRARDLEMVLAARSADGSSLLPGPDRRRLVAFDCTFSSPKSVSLLASIAPESFAEAAIEAHGAAVTAALSYLERTAVFVRRSRTGQRTTVPARGLVAAGLLHRASRAPDPHLHTHVLVANLASDATGRVSALDARPLFDDRSLAGALYEAELRHRLARDLGVVFRDDGHGVIELVGVSDAARRAFSRRSAAIATALADSGFSSPRAARLAAAMTRPAKDAGVARREVEAAWSARASALGLGAARWTQVAPGRALQVGLDAPSVRERFDAPFTRRDLLGALARSAVQGATVGTLERLADALVADAPAVAPSGWRVRRFRGGRGAFPGGVPEQTYTNPAIEEAQERVVQAVTRAEDAVLSSLPRRSGVFVAEGGGDEDVARAIAALRRSGRPVRVTGDVARAEPIARLAGARLEATGLHAALRAGDVRVVIDPHELGSRPLAALFDVASRDEGSLVLLLAPGARPPAGDRARWALRNRHATLVRVAPRPGRDRGERGREAPLPVVPVRARRIVGAPGREIDFGR